MAYLATFLPSPAAALVDSLVKTLRSLNARHHQDRFECVRLKRMTDRDLADIGLVRAADVANLVRPLSRPRV